MNDYTDEYAKLGYENLLLKINGWKKELLDLNKDNDGKYYFLQLYELDNFSCIGVYETLYSALLDKIRIIESNPNNFLTFPENDPKEFYRNASQKFIDIKSFTIPKINQSNVVTVQRGICSNMTEIVYIRYNDKIVWKQPGTYILENPIEFEIKKLEKSNKKRKRD